MGIVYFCIKKINLKMEDLTTEQKIAAAARKIFTQKGYAATKTRDIAEEAGINLALVNYYFGSKENLFKQVLKEKFEALFGLMMPVLSDRDISLDEKIRLLVKNYTKLLIENEELPIFVLNELRNNENIFNPILQQARTISQPTIDEQLQHNGFAISTPDFIMNIVSLTIFP
ncbi:MAG TPA: TetR family transcriptional regulator, partial [Porphyromonadaceae bacterium]|nr:TetR family transcriptional regulator [Porphyromonadaceae bacterium]HCF81606.1 TetR family transcriptional regulator [Porphyromonadaceae bacterium]